MTKLIKVTKLHSGLNEIEATLVPRGLKEGYIGKIVKRGEDLFFFNNSWGWTPSDRLSKLCLGYKFCYHLLQHEIDGGVIELFVAKQNSPLSYVPFL